MAGQLCTNCHAPLETAGVAPGGVVRCAYCKTENRALGAGLAHVPATPPAYGGPPTPGFGAPPGGFGPPPGAPPTPGFGGGFGAPTPGFGAPTPGFGAPPTPGVIGGPTGLPGSLDANPKPAAAPPPSVVMPSSAGTNTELLGGIGALLAWKGLVAIAGLVVPLLCCLSWAALQLFVGSLGR